MPKAFLKAGHLPTLFAAFLYFDFSFMVWVLLGPLGVAIAKQLTGPCTQRPDGRDAGPGGGAPSASAGFAG